MTTDHPSNKNGRDLLHHLLVHLRLRMKIITTVKTSKLNLLILRVAWHQRVVSLLQASNVEETTQVLVVRSPLVVLSVVIMVISRENVQRTSREIEHSLQLLHQTELHLEGLLPYCGGTNCLYGINILQDQKDSSDIVIGMIQVFDFTVYALLDPQARSSFLNPYVSMNFDVIPEQLSELFSVSTLVSDSILAEMVYHDYLIFPQSEDYHG